MQKYWEDMQNFTKITTRNYKVEWCVHNQINTTEKTKKIID